MTFFFKYTRVGYEIFTEVTPLNVHILDEIFQKYGLNNTAFCSISKNTSKIRILVAFWKRLTAKN